MGPTWVLSAPVGPHVGPMNLATKGALVSLMSCWAYYLGNGRVVGGSRRHNAHVTSLYWLVDIFSVDKKERENGRDPEKECVEDGFQDYQRPYVENPPNSQIPQCTRSISHNAPFRTAMCTFLLWMVYCGICNRSMAVFFRSVYHYMCTRLCYAVLCSGYIISSLWIRLMYIH